MYILKLIPFLCIMCTTHGWSSMNNVLNLRAPHAVPVRQLQTRNSERTLTGLTMSQDVPLSRKHFLTLAGSCMSVVPTLVNADSTGKFSSKGLGALNSLEKGEIEVDAFLSIADDMVTAMKLYGQAQKKGEYPDKTSERCVKDAEIFGKAVAALKSGGSTAEAKEKFDVYFEHLTRDGREPFGSGMAPKMDAAE